MATTDQLKKRNKELEKALQRLVDVSEEWPAINSTSRPPWNDWFKRRRVLLDNSTTILKRELDLSAWGQAETQEQPDPYHFCC